jgi:hypothetical protein
VEAAQSIAAGIVGQTDLRKFRFEPVPRKFLTAKGAREKTTIIMHGVDFYKESTRYLRFDESQSSTLAFGIGTMNLPPQDRT